MRTYVQSGNILFESPEERTAAVLEKVRVKLRDLLGDEPGVFVRTVHEVQKIMKGAPFRPQSRSLDFEAVIS